MQFFVFLLAFFAKLLIQLIYVLGSGHDWSYFTYYFMESASHIVVSILPVTFMLYSHHKTYRMQPEDENDLDISKEMDLSEAATDDQEETVVMLCHTMRNDTNGNKD